MQRLPEVLSAPGSDVIAGFKAPLVLGTGVYNTNMSTLPIRVDTREEAQFRLVKYAEIKDYVLDRLLHCLGPNDAAHARTQ